MSDIQKSTTKVIVLGNEKGGTGKSTTAMHLIVALMRDGDKVASIDLDTRQGSLTRYIENRRAFAQSKQVKLPIPSHKLFEASALDNVSDAREDERVRFDRLIMKLAGDFDYIVIDCPGSDSYLGRHALTLTNTLVTPVNDSYVDLDVLAKVGGTPPRVIGPSTYSQIVWQQRQQRRRLNGGPIDWVVLRNRLSPLDSRNKVNVGETLIRLAEQIGFRLVEGFFERTIFRQLFLQGLTVLDLREDGTSVSLSLSHVAARQEVRTVLNAVKYEAPAEDPEETAAPIHPTLTGAPSVAIAASGAGPAKA